ncbi:MAG TPA: T9SS type A sorting domain-containing protein [Niastella sp.]
MPKAVQIHIPQPCHENWHNMTPNEQGRFCGACQKTVVDFSAMSDKELLEYIANVSGYTACGRFSNDQLNRTIKTAENKRRFSWAYLWNILVATFMITEANAQACPPKKKRAMVPTSINKSDTVNTAISTIGYKAETVNMDINKVRVTEPVDLSVALSGRLGGYYVEAKPTVKERVTRIVNSCIPASLKKDVVVYPNPVARGEVALFKLALPKGNYNVDVISTAGEVIWQTSVNIQTKEQQVQFPTREHWSAGTYLVRISSDSTTKIFQSKMLLQ